MESKLTKTPPPRPKGILKEAYCSSSELGGASSDGGGGGNSNPHTPKHLCWDEEKLAITEAGKGTCTIHINEPKTPFVPLSNPKNINNVDDDDDDDEFQLERGSISDSGSTSSSKYPTSGSEWDDELSEHGEFLAKRRASYRMRGAMSLGRKLLEDEEE